MDTPTEAFTVNAILDRYQADCFESLATRTQQDYAGIIRTLRIHFGERIAADLVPRDFAPFMNVSKGKISRNRHLAVMSAAFHYAMKRLYWIDRNVLRDVTRHETRPRTRYITDEEFNAVRAMMPLRHQLAMDLALLTGQRQGDLLSLKWSQLQDMVLLFQQAKTKKRLAIAVSPALEAVLDQCWMLPGRDEYVLTRVQGGRFKTSGFKSVWQRYMRRASRGYSKKAHRGAKAVYYPPVIESAYTFHDIRAKSASDTLDINAASSRLGHTNLSMTKRVYDRGYRLVQPLS